MTIQRALIFSWDQGSAPLAFRPGVVWKVYVFAESQYLLNTKNCRLQYALKSCIFLLFLGRCN